MKQKYGSLGKKKNQWNWQISIKIYREKKSDLKITNYQYQKLSRRYHWRFCRHQKDKRILQTTLHIEIWQLTWNGTIPQEAQTTIKCKIDTLNTLITIKEIEFVILKLD